MISSIVRLTGTSLNIVASCLDINAESFPPLNFSNNLPFTLSKLTYTVSHNLLNILAIDEVDRM